MTEKSAMVGQDETYQNLFTDSQVPMLIISPERGEIVRANQAAVRFYGYQEKQLTSLNINNINQLTPEEVQLEMERAKNLKRNHFIFRHKLANGEIRDVEVYSSPIVFNGHKLLFSVIHDITDRIRAEKQLNIYAQLFISSIDMLAVIDGQHKYLAANQVYLDFLGKKEGQVIGKHAIEVLGEKDYQSYLPYLEQAISGKFVQYERQFISSQNILTVQEIRYFPFFDSYSTQTGVVGVLRDISDQKQAEAQLKLSAAVFQSTSEGIVISNNKGEIIDANQAFIDLSGFSKASIIGRSYDTLLQEANPLSSLETMDFIKNNHLWREEMSLETRQHNTIPVSATINKVTGKSGQVQYSVCIIRDISDYKQASEKLTHLAHHDILTQLPNRLVLKERIEQHIQRAKRQSSLIYIIFIDLDRFKSINDSLGHSIGDALLVSVANRLKQNIRLTDTVARVGGDEFIIVIEVSDKPYEIMQTIKRLIDSFNTPFDVEHHSLFVTASIGVSQYPSDGDKTNQLISNADAAMYHAKQQGRNQFSFFSEVKADEIEQQIKIENALRGALHRDEFELFFQPQVTLLGRQCVGFEVLLRWHNPELAYISPSIFIPLAEKLGLISELGSWVLRHACEQGKKWQEAGVNFGKLSVNVSGTQLKDRNFCSNVKRILKQTGFSANYLEIEITEDFVMNQAEQSISQLTALRQLGVDIAIDDFGTGYSSLSYLKRLPVNKLKIDRSFISDIGKDNDSKIITKSIIALGQAMHLKVIAEGVENALQADTLISQGCEQAQGFLYGKPMPADKVTYWIKNNQDSV